MLTPGRKKRGYGSTIASSRITMEKQLFAKSILSHPVLLFSGLSYRRGDSNLPTMLEAATR